MMRACLCQKISNFFSPVLHRSIDSSLRTDPSFLADILDKAPWLVERIDDSTFQQFPDVVVQAFRPYALWLRQSGESREWQSWRVSRQPVRADGEDILLDWFRAGLYYAKWWPGGYPNRWPGIRKHEKRAFLLIAEHCIPNSKGNRSCAPRPSLGITKGS